MDYLDFLYEQWEKDVENGETNLTWEEYEYYVGMVNNQSQWEY